MAQTRRRGGPFPPPRRILPGFPEAEITSPKTPRHDGGGLRKRWRDRSGRIYEWDYQHGTVEVYDRRGRHIGERIDPFNGEGAFHRGVDISGAYGEPVIAPADGEVVFAHAINGYGRTVILDHGHSVTTLYGHLSNFAVIAGQEIHRGDIIGYIGLTGRSTGPHLHYEVRIHDTPVNPYKYLRITLAHSGGFAAGS